MSMRRMALSLGVRSSHWEESVEENAAEMAEGSLPGEQLRSDLETLPACE